MICPAWYIALHKRQQDYFQGVHLGRSFRVFFSRMHRLLEGVRRCWGRYMHPLRGENLPGGCKYTPLYTLSAPIFLQLHKSVYWHVFCLLFRVTLLCLMQTLNSLKSITR